MFMNSPLESPAILSHFHVSSVPRRKEEQPPPGFRHRHGRPGDGEGCCDHPVTVQEIPEKEAGCEVVEWHLLAWSSADVGPVMHVN